MATIPVTTLKNGQKAQRVVPGGGVGRGHAADGLRRDLGTLEDQWFVIDAVKRNDL